MNKYFIGILFCFVVFTACESPVNKSITPELPFSFSTEIASLDSIKPEVLKIVGDSDSYQTSTINWKAELNFFNAFEDLYSKHKSDYSRKTFSVNDDITKELQYDVIEYTSKNLKRAVKKASYFFAGSKCVKVIIIRHIQNSLVEQTQVLTYEPEVGYSITGEQEIQKSNKLKYELKAKFISKNLWRATLNIGKEILPFNFSMSETEIVIYNAEERIYVTEISKKEDSIFIDLPFFDSEIKGVYNGQTITGNWHNYAKGDYTIPFNALQSNKRFDYNTKVSSLNINGKWEVMFSPGTKNQYPAIGVFKQDGNFLSGTFITETGDYRFLEGYIEGKNLKLSCFDGAHAFLFTGSVDEKGDIDGKFYSGKHWTESWTASKNDNASVKDPYKLTHLATTDSVFNISFPNLDSNIISLNDIRFRNKPVLIQIMGSWCPNCMDESRLLTEFYQDYNPKGLEIIALCFERSENFTENKSAIEKIKTDLNIPYEMLIAGKASKKEASRKLPMLNHIMSYPTTIYLDSKHKVQRIHTGFYGPGTGPYYNRFVIESKNFIEELLQ